MSLDRRTLRQVIDSVSEKAKVDGVPDAVVGGLLMDVMRLRNIHLRLNTALPNNAMLKNPVQPQE